MNTKNFIAKLQTNTQILLGSIVCFLYFITLHLLYNYNIDFPLIRFFGELITIPFVLLTASLLVYTIYLLSTKKQNINLKLGTAIIFLIAALFLIFQ